MQLLPEELKKIALFEALSPEQIDNLIKHAQKLSLRKNQVLFRMGEKSNHFYYLRSGMVKIARSSPQGLEKVLTIVNPGQLFAEAAMFLQDARFPATASAIVSSDVIGFENRIFTSYLKQSDNLSLAMISNLSQRLHGQIIEIDNLTMQNANYRLLNYLNNLIPSSTSDTVTVELPGPKQTIASRLSITPETLSRALHSLNELELIKIQGRTRQITIPSVINFREYMNTH